MPKKAWLLPLFLVTLGIFSVPVLAYQNSSILCISNQTLQENITVYKDGNMTNLTLNNWCQNGCDNVSAACSPPPYQQNLIIIGILIVVGIIIIKVAT